MPHGFRQEFRQRLWGQSAASLGRRSIKEYCEAPGLHLLPRGNHLEERMRGQSGLPVARKGDVGSGLTRKPDKEFPVMQAIEAPAQTWRRQQKVRAIMFGQFRAVRVAPIPRWAAVQRDFTIGPGGEIHPVLLCAVIGKANRDECRELLALTELPPVTKDALQGNRRQMEVRLALAIRLDHRNHSMAILVLHAVHPASNSLRSALGPVDQDCDREVIAPPDGACVEESDEPPFGQGESELPPGDTYWSGGGLHHSFN